MPLARGDSLEGFPLDRGIVEKLPVSVLKEQRWEFSLAGGLNKSLLRPSPLTLRFPFKVGLHSKIYRSELGNGALMYEIDFPINSLLPSMLAHPTSHFPNGECHEKPHLLTLDAISNKLRFSKLSCLGPKL